MSSLPMTALPVTAAAPTGGEPQVADGQQHREPGFATALTAALGARPRPHGADPLQPAAEQGDDVHDQPAPDLVYHVHTATAAPVAAAPAEAGTRQVTEHAPPSVHGDARDQRSSTPLAPLPLHAADGRIARQAPHGMQADGSRMARGSAAAAPDAPAPPDSAGASVEPADAAEGAARPAPASRRSIDVAIRDASLLQPEFRARLDRVISRLESMGHTVEVIETYRDQARQEHLFAQGRSRPGSVVTWTRHSNHTQGRAADLLIDGSFEPSAGYARLAQVAAEEGLRTLGARDPGHVELPGGSRSQMAGTPMPGRGADAAGIAHVATPAAPAAVAAIAAPAALAAPAAIAAVAAVAAPGSAFAGAGAPPSRSAVHAPTAGRDTTSDVSDADTTLHVRAAVGRDAEDGRDRAVAGPHRDASAGESLRESQAPAERVEARPFAAATEATGYTSESDAPAGPGSAAASVTQGAPAAAARPQPVGQVADADIAGRVARVLQLQADAAAQPLTRVTLRLGDDGAEMGRVRIDMRGGTVATSIDLADPVRAAELRGRVHELESALQQRGLETARLSVRSAAEASAAAALAAASRPAGADAVPLTPTLESLLSQQLARTNDRSPEGGRQHADREPRQQKEQEAK